MRPTYETQKDRSNEREVIDFLCSKWKCSAHKTPQFYPVDWSLTKGNAVKAMVEVKVRTKSYDSYLISGHKWSEAIKSSEALGVPYLLAVCWPEMGRRVVRYVKVARGIHDRLIHGGRRDRGDDQDMEPMVEINMNKFTFVGEL